MSAPNGDAVAGAVEHMRALAADLDRQAVQYREQLAAMRAQFARDDEERARAARSGQLGPQWQKLQRRIDLDETSVGDLVTGNDESSEASALRANAAARLRMVYAEQAAEVEEEGDPVIEETVALQGEIRAMVAEVAAMRPPAL